MKLIFYGACDDLFEVESDNGKVNEELNSFDGSVILTSNSGRMRIRYHYAKGGCWDVWPQLFTDGEHLPWPTRYIKNKRNDYSVCLEVECPDDVIVN